MIIGVVGIGNCASSLFQCIEADEKGNLSTGVSHPLISKYRVKDIKIGAAFDIDHRKVGKTLDQAAKSAPNCTTIRQVLSPSDVLVSRGILSDGVSEEMKASFQIDESCLNVNVKDIVAILKKANCNILISYLPVGSQKASEQYAEAALIAGIAFINCTPAVIASSEVWRKRYSDAGLALLGDDIKSQFGSTAIHRSLLNLLAKKGLKVIDTYQMNIGGNTDFQNMSLANRSEQKKHTKEKSLSTLLDGDTALNVNPSSYVPPLNDYKVGYFNIRGEGILGMPFTLDMKIHLEDSPNSAGVAVNAIRACQVAIDRKMSGCIDGICPYFFKNPYVTVSEEESLNCLNNFIIDINND